MSPEDLYGRLLQRTGFETVTKAVAAKQIRVLGRVRDGGVPTWLRVVERLLLRADKAEWNVDISKQYFMRGDKLLYGWRIILQAEDINKHLSDIIQVIDSTPVAAGGENYYVDSDEVPLHGNPNRLALKNGKGAQPMESAKILAVQR